ncbi:MAG TPA: adenosylcobinamide-GDP ribazoletransferase [Paracoccaceae bacterium]|nr:adenosylcobinamide-GDP ribazoletransferase [Paracoccaceae bacterium]
MTPAPLRRVLGELRMGFLILTRLPVGSLAGDVPTMGASAWGWPVVGLVVGGISALIWWLALAIGLPPLPAAVLAVLAGTLATGGLHEDGLADLADGFGGGKDKTRRLEIMRDSRIGSYGALGIGFSLLLRVGALAGLGACDGALALIALGAASRAMMPAALHLMPAAREDGLGRAAGGVGQRPALLALAIGFAALWLTGPAALATAAAMVVAAIGLGWLALRRIGGQTGDVLGAMQQVAELAGWLALSALLTAV